MFNLKKYKNIFMIGIGGVSMSGLAYILKQYGYKISGSNNVENNMTKSLNNSGIKVHIPHCSNNINKDIDLVVYTAAIKKDNEELVKARDLNIKTLERGEFLGELTKLFKETIGITGTHGKTSTTSMVSLCFLEAGLDPTIQVGSRLSNINGNYKVGNSDYFIIESCEYKDSFLNFHEKSAIVLNIDNDHLDYFGNIDNIKKSFKEYVSHITNVLVLNSDDKNVLELALHSKAKILTFGLSENSNYYAKNIEFNELGYPSYDLYKNKKYIDRINLNIVGMHNILNSLSCIALCDYYNISLENIKKALISYKGAERRFEYKGDFNGAKVYDDYGHHPTEVEAVSKSILNKKINKSYVIFEPHTYSRVKNHASDFAKSLINFDNIIIADIYAAREKNEFNVSENDIINELKKLGKDSTHISDYEEIKKYLKDKVKDNDIILTLGAGNITKLSEILTNEKE